MLERYFIQLTFVIFQEFKDSLGEIPYPTDIYYILRIWRFYWKDTWSHWHLLFLTIWRLYCKDTLPDWHLLFLIIWRFCWTYTLSYRFLLLLRNLKNLLERYILPLTFIISQKFENRFGKISYPTETYYFLKIWRFCWKDTLSEWNLLFFLRIWRFYSNNTLSDWNLFVI